MKHSVTVPSPGESINEVFIGTWLKKTGDFVKKDEVLVDLETQKTTFELQAEADGQIEVLVPQAETVVKPGDVIAYIDDAVKGNSANATQAAPVKVAAAETSAKPAPKSSPAPAEAQRPNLTVVSSAGSDPVLSPAARKQAADLRVDPFGVPGSGRGGRVMKEDVLNAASAAPAKPAPVTAPTAAPTKSNESPYQYRVDTSRGERIEPASRIRRQIAQNLVAAQHTAAILTTFNEVDMGALISFRKKNKEALTAKYGVAPGIVSFFAMASVRALKEYPLVNSTFTGDEIIHRDFVDLGVAVSTESGLVVPVVRDAQKLNLMEFEKRLAELAERARLRKLSIPEMTGGSFTISNGGVFGSLLSTPILNMPQSAILGLHKTQERPVVQEGQIAIKPMMYLALSYDHRLVDGREAVLFLVKIKEGIENISLIINEKGLL